MKRKWVPEYNGCNKTLKKCIIMRMQSHQILWKKKLNQQKCCRALKSRWRIFDLESRRFSTKRQIDQTMLMALGIKMSNLHSNLHELLQERVEFGNALD